MRLNRLTKLAQLKKVAVGDSRVTDNMALEQDKKRLDSDAAAKETESNASSAEKTEDSVAIIKNDTNIDVLLKVNDGNSNTLSPGSMRYADTTKKVAITSIAKSNSKEFPVGYFKPDFTYNISDLINVAEYTSGTSGKSSSQPQATRGTVKALVIKYPADTKLADGDYEYEVSDPANQFEWKRKSDGKTGFFERASSGTPKWNQAVTRLNALSPISSVAATPAAQTPAATTPTAEEAAKTQQAGRQFDANALAGVKAVLVRAATPGGFGLAVTTAANERARIQRMVSVIQKRVGQNIDAYDFLTKMLLVSPRGEQSLVPWFSAENYSNAIATAPRKDVVADKNGTGPFNKPVAAVLSVLNEVYNGDFADDNEGTVDKFKETFVKGYTPAQPAANTAAAPAAKTGAAPASNTPAASATNPPTPPPSAPAAPAATQTQTADKADDGHSKSSSRVDPRIKKLATLRRLRVRSQMEAATDSSAQFGRSRVS